MAIVRVPDLSKFEWQKSVKDKDILSPPPSPAAGDRYLIYGTGSGDWANKDNQIATWTGAAWEYVPPRKGMCVWVEDEGQLYRSVDGATWSIVPAGHERLHSITSPLDHTSTATPGRMLRADANGLPIEATNTDAEVADAVAKRHIQGTDTTLGTMTANIAMGGNRVTGLGLPMASGDAIRQTTIITEANLEDTIRKRAVLNVALGTIDFDL